MLNKQVREFARLAQNADFMGVCLALFVFRERKNWVGVEGPGFLGQSNYRQNCTLHAAALVELG